MHPSCQHVHHNTGIRATAQNMELSSLFCSGGFPGSDLILTCSVLFCSDGQNESTCRARPGQLVSTQDFACSGNVRRMMNYKIVWSRVSRFCSILFKKSSFSLTEQNRTEQNRTEQNRKSKFSKYRFGTSWIDYSIIRLPNIITVR